MPSLLVDNLLRERTHGLRVVPFWRTFSLKNCASNPPSVLIQRLRVKRTTTKARKLRAIHALGRDIAGRPLDYVARKYFLRHIRTSRFGEAHVKHLTALKLPWVRETNARFIIRNLGGEDLKPDRWIVKLMEVFQSDRAEFVAAAEELGWRLGYLDLVLWRYCVQEIKRVRLTHDHFQRLGLFGVGA